ncbi:MAG: hypothetical protein K0S38_916, partial [Candidatus Paceibacter sp.]|nr:hypothetical protein [Candidatus Paceibacter sp.]
VQVKVDRGLVVALPDEPKPLFFGLDR